jgi:hypothetical protein
MTFNPLLKEESVQIARDFLQRSGEIEDVHAAELLLTDTVEFLMQHGISNRLLLSNLAITAYQRFRQQKIIDVPEARKASWMG